MADESRVLCHLVQDPELFELDRFNLNPTMPSILRVLDQMQENFGAKW